MGDPQIYVRGFPKYTSEEDLRTAFSTFGDIKEVRMIRDYAFIVHIAPSRFSIQRSPFRRQSMTPMAGTSTIPESRSRSQDSLRSPKDLSRTTSADSVARRDTGTFLITFRKNDCPDLRRDR